MLEETFKKPRYSVLTYIMGVGYEILRDVLEKDPDAEYICVTDDPDLKSDTWTVVCDVDLKNSDYSPFERVLRVRYNPFKYVHSDICIRVDGSIQVRKPLTKLIDIFEGGAYDLSFIPHPVYNILDEYNNWRTLRGLSLNDCERAIMNMTYDGYDFNYKGNIHLIFSICRNTDEQNRLNREVFEYTKKCGNMFGVHRVDQCILAFVLNKRYNHLKVLPLSIKFIYTEWLLGYYHNSPYYHIEPYMKESLLEKDVQWLFNEPVECLQSLYD